MRTNLFTMRDNISPPKGWASLLPGLVGATALLFFSGSFIFWNVDIRTGTISIFLLSLASLPLLHGGRSLGKIQLVAALFFLAVMLVLYTPFRPFSGSVLGFALPLTVFLYFLFDPRHLEKSLYLFAAICGVSAVSSLVVFVLNLVGFDPPHIILTQEFRRNAADFYKLYPGSILLNTQSWWVGIGRVVRTSGIFMEPGHYAMICSALLICYRYQFRTRMAKSLLLGGLLTFSPAFIIMTAAGIALNLELKQHTRAFWLSLLIMLSIALFLEFAPQPLVDRLLYNNLAVFSESGLAGVLDERSHGDIAGLYDSLSLGEKFIGIGSAALEELGLLNVHSSDYRSFVIGYGFVSFGAIILFYSFLGRLCVSDREVLVIAFFLSLIFLHRSWMLSQMWVHLIIISYYLVSYRNNRMLTAGLSKRNEKPQRPARPKGMAHMIADSSYPRSG